MPAAFPRHVDTIVLVSGGIDSAVALAWTLEQGWEPRALTVGYHERPDAEVRALERQLDRRDLAPPIEIGLPFLREVEDLQVEAPHLDDAPQGYVPARNAVFYSVAAHVAEKHGAHRIVGGHNGGDGDEFPDARGEFFMDLFDLINRGLHSGDDRPLRIRLPLKDRTKAEVIELGDALDVDFAGTWSCNYDGETHCGSCSSCRKRRAAFETAGLEDPIEYETPEVTG